MADGAHLRRNFAAVPRHPDIVPAKHDDGDDQHACVEQLLAIAFEQFRQRAGKSGNDAGADQAYGNAAADQEATPGDALRDGEHDADDEAGFDDFAKDNEQRTEHWRVFVPGDDISAHYRTCHLASNRYLFDLEAFETVVSRPARVS